MTGAEFNTIAGGRRNKRRSLRPSRTVEIFRFIGTMITVTGFYFLLPLLLVL
jgi:hypothetical protein